METEFSLILPSRNRPNLLKNCLNSFFRKANNVACVEAIVLFDFDDYSIRRFESMGIPSEWNVKFIFQRQSRKMIHDYNNYGSQCSTGKYIWQINDDVEIVTNKWDHLLKERIDQFLSNKPDRILYVHVNDSTHSGRDLGCCFPILSVESVNTQNCHMPSEISMWGADVYLYKIYKNFPDRVLNLETEIKLLHHSRHNGTAVPDSTAHSVKDVFENGCHALTQEQYHKYVSLLRDRIKQFAKC